MFGVDTTELLIIAVAALIFIGPKDLPRVMRTVGYWIGRVRGMARHFTAGVETMMREAELEEMEKKWREENERIMREHPPETVSPEAAPVASWDGPHMGPLPLPPAPLDPLAEVSTETPRPADAPERPA